MTVAGVPKACIPRLTELPRKRRPWGITVIREAHGIVLGQSPSDDRTFCSVHKMWQILTNEKASTTQPPGELRE